MAKTILLVGARSGIGAATAHALAAEGHEVLRAGRDEAARAAGLAFDAQAEAPLAWALPASLDGMAYFPGNIRLKPLARLTPAEFREDFELNCVGAVRAIQAALPALKQAPAASIVLFSSIAGAQGMAFHASVGAAKGAVEGLARSLAAELAPRIRVNVVAPSLTDTPLAASLLDNDAKRAAAAARHPLRAVGDPADVAALVAFLLSAAAKGITGQVLRPDGGLSRVRLFA